MHPLLRLLRPHQYAKNLLVFAAPGAAGRLDEAGIVWRSTLAFVLFCAVSSGGYILNDLLDAEADRLHPRKKLRPIASGDVSTNQAGVLFAAIVLPAVALSPLLGWSFTATLAGYAAVSAGYSTVLKRIPWIELLAVSAGFLLRAIGGGTATDITISRWFLLVVSAGALLMITGKRVGELLALGAQTASRKVLARYRITHLRFMAAVAALLSVGGYATWAAAGAANQVSNSTGSTLLRLSALPFTIAIARYLVLSWRGAGETPEALVVRDKWMVAAGACWVVVYAAGLYL